MVLLRVDDLTAYPWGWRLYVRNVTPTMWLDAVLLLNIAHAWDHAIRLEWEPKFEVVFHEGAMLALTIHAENGTWTWRFVEYDHQRDAYLMVWPD